MAATDKRRLKYWGWGYEDAGLDGEQTKALLATFADDFGIAPSRDGAFPALDAIDLPTADPAGALQGSWRCSSSRRL